MQWSTGEIVNQPPRPFTSGHPSIDKDSATANITLDVSPEV